MTTSMRVTQTLAAASLCLVAGCSKAGAPQTLSRQLQLAPDGAVRVELPAGEITVTGDAAATSAHVSGRLASGQNLQVTGDPSHLLLRVTGSAAGARGWLSWLFQPTAAETRIALSVPAGVALEFLGASADLWARGLSGGLTATSASGDLHVDATAARLKLGSASGDIEVRDPAAVDADIATVSGDQRLYGLGGRLRLASVSGDIELHAGQLRALTVRTASGDQHLSLPLQDDAQIESASASGDVFCDFSGGARLDLTTGSGDIVGDAALTWDASHHHANAVVGEGGAQLRIRTASGDIHLTPRQP